MFSARRTSAGLPPDVAAAARALPGVRQVSGSLATTVIVTSAATDLRSLPARAVDVETLPAVIDLGLSSGSLEDLHGAALAVAADDARDFGWHVGERVHVWLGDGTPVTLRVAAIFTRPLGFGDIVIPRALAERHVTDALDDAVFVRGGSRAVLEQLRQANPDLEVTTRKQFGQAVVDAEQQKSLAVYVLLGLIVVFCALAAVNAVMMSTAERAREFARLRLIGAGKRQIATMVRAETLIMVAFGLAIGSLHRVARRRDGQPRPHRLGCPLRASVGLRRPGGILRSTGVRRQRHLGEAGAADGSGARDGRARVTHRAVGAGDLAELARARLDGALLRGAVDGDEPERRPVAEDPLEVVEQRPVEVAAHVEAVAQARLDAAQRARR